MASLEHCSQKNSSTIKTQASIRGAFAALKVAAKRLAASLILRHGAAKSDQSFYLSSTFMALGPLPPILAL